MGLLVTNHFEATAMVLFGIGFVTLLLHKNLIKKIIGLNIMDTAVFLFLATRGYITGRAAPIIADAHGVIDASLYINPLPSALVLTGIVVAVSITAFSLALSLKLYEQYGTLDMDKIALMSHGGKG